MIRSTFDYRLSNDVKRPTIWKIQNIKADLADRSPSIFPVSISVADTSKRLCIRKSNHLSVLYSGCRSYASSYLQRRLQIGGKRSEESWFLYDRAQRASWSFHLWLYVIRVWQSGPPSYTTAMCRKGGYRRLIILLQNSQFYLLDLLGWTHHWSRKVSIFTEKIYLVFQSVRLHV